MCDTDSNKICGHEEREAFSLPDNDAIVVGKNSHRSGVVLAMQRRCVGDGDHNRDLMENHLRRKENFRRCETLTLYFRQIYELVRKLENSLAISRQIENHEFMHIVMLNSENKHLRAEIEELQQKLQMKRLLEDKFEEREDMIRDHEISCNTMSIVNLQYTYNELWASHQHILKTLSNRDEELKMMHEKLANLEKHSHELKENILKKDVTINELCVKYLKLKNRRDMLEKNLKGEIKSLNKSLERSDRMLTKHFALTESKIKQLLLNTTSSKDALLLHEIHRSNRLMHENIKLKRQLSDQSFNPFTK